MVIEFFRCSFTFTANMNQISRFNSELALVMIKGRVIMRKSGIDQSCFIDPLLSKSRQLLIQIYCGAITTTSIA